MTDETLKVIDNNWEAFEEFIRNHPDKQGQLGAPLCGHKPLSKEETNEPIRIKVQSINKIV